MINAHYQPEPQKTLRKSTWMDTAQLVVSILVFIIFLAVSTLCFVALAQGQNIVMLRDLVPSLWALAFGALILAAIALVSAIKSRQVYLEKPIKRQVASRFTWLNGIIVLLPLLLLAGYFVWKAYQPPAFLLPLITILALGIAMLWILKIGTGDQWAMNSKRDTGLFSFSMSFGTLFIMIVQFLLIILVTVVAFLFIAQNTELMNAFNKLSFAMQEPEQFVKTFAKTGVGTMITIGLLILMTIIAPLSEELFKTLGVWFLKGRTLSPSEGWIAGLMCGAGFGLIEGFLFSMQGSLVTSFEDWLVFALGRVGGLLLHTFNGGLIGYALSKSWREKRPGPAIGAYLISMLIHGIWNFVAISQITFGTLFGIELPDVALYILLPALAVGMLIALIGMRRKIWREELAFRQAFDDFVIKVLQDESLLIGQGN